MNQFKAIKCSLCGYDKIKSIYQNPICGHSYCSNCISSRHVPDKDKMKCFFRICNKTILIDDLDSYFLKEQMEKLENSKDDQNSINKPYDSKFLQKNQSSGEKQSQDIYGKESMKQQAEKNNSYPNADIKQNKPIYPMQDNMANASQAMYQSQSHIYNNENQKKDLSFQDTYNYCGKCFQKLMEDPYVTQKMDCKHSICFSCFIQNNNRMQSGCNLCLRWQNYNY